MIVVPVLLTFIVIITKVLHLATRLALVDSIFAALLIGYSLHVTNGLHPAICLVIGIAIFLFLYIAQSTKIGYWTISVIFSLIWAGFVSSAVEDYTNGDMIWKYVSMGLTFLVALYFHQDARYPYER